MLQDSALDHDGQYGCFLQRRGTELFLTDESYDGVCESTLLLAMRFGRREVFAALLRKGASVGSPKGGEDPCSYALRTYSDPQDCLFYIQSCIATKSFRDYSLLRKAFYWNNCSVAQALAGDVRLCVCADLELLSTLLSGGEGGWMTDKPFKGDPLLLCRLEAARGVATRSDFLPELAIPGVLSSLQEHASDAALTALFRSEECQQTVVRLHLEVLRMLMQIPGVQTPDDAVQKIIETRQRWRTGLGGGVMDGGG